MANPKMTEQWLKRARKDLHVAEYLFASDQDFNEDIVFFCQQTIEKSLKSYLVNNDIRVKKTHILGELLTACPENFSIYFKEITPKRMSEYAVKFRYPDAEIKELESSEVEPALNIARQILKRVTELLI